MYNRKKIKSFVPAAVFIGLAAMVLISSGFAHGYKLSTDNSQAKRLYEKGLALVEEEKFEPALELFSRAVEIDPQFMQAHFRYIDVSRSLGRGDKVIEEYRIKAEQNPKSARALYFYGRALQDLAEKMRQYRATLQLDSKFFWAQYGIGGIYLIQRRYDEAIVALNKTLEMNPKMIEAIHLLGTVYLEKDMLFQALELFEEAVVIDNENPSVYMSLGQAYSRMDKYESAEKAFRNATALSPNSPLTYYYLGLVCEMQQRNEQAVIEYENFLRLAPDHELASMVANNIKKLRK
jgi:tetratricopeptide (TPR) repeat protein